MSCVEAIMIGDSAFVLDVEKARVIFSKGFFGLPIGVEKPKDPNFDTPLRLSLYETLYLAEKGILCVRDLEGKPFSLEELRSLVLQNKRSLVEYMAYKSLRDSNFVVRSALKYGGDFLVYRLGPGLEHAPFIVHSYDIDDEIDPLKIVMAQRVSHSVRKSLVFAVVSRERSIHYLIFRWVRF
ncbi:MAG: tRNA-intron lyase [Acidilobaceae archaeon]